MTETNRDFIADKDREYKQYLIWKSLPRDINKELFEKLGVTDQDILELSNIRTQKELAEYLNVRPTTVSDWNKHPIPEEYKELDWRYWAKKTTPSLISAVLREGRKHGDAGRFSAWMKYVEQVEEKSSVRIDTSDELLDTLKAIAERHGDS